jgi:primosomal protein N' (replication factor Y)
MKNTTRATSSTTPRLATTHGTWHKCSPGCTARKHCWAPPRPAWKACSTRSTGKYGFARLDVRHGDAVLPTIIRVDLNEAHKAQANARAFFQELLAGIEQALGAERTSDHFPEPARLRAGVAVRKLRLGARMRTLRRKPHLPQARPWSALPLLWPALPTTGAMPGLRSNRLRMVGLGTEKVEEELALLLPEARGARMDQDTTRGKHAFERLLQRFGDGASTSWWARRWSPRAWTSSRSR